MPIVFTVLVSFTNYGGEIVPPKLIDWMGFANISMIFTVSEYAMTILKILGRNLIWAIGATFTNYFGGLGLALLYNSKRLKGQARLARFSLVCLCSIGLYHIDAFSLSVWLLRVLDFLHVRGSVYRLSCFLQRIFFRMAIRIYTRDKSGRRKRSSRACCNHIVTVKTDYPIIVFTAVPIVILYIALSRYLIQGGAAGAVKE